MDMQKYSVSNNNMRFIQVIHSLVHCSIEFSHYSLTHQCIYLVNASSTVLFYIACVIITSSKRLSCYIASFHWHSSQHFHHSHMLKYAHFLILHFLSCVCYPMVWFTRCIYPHNQDFFTGIWTTHSANEVIPKYTTIIVSYRKTSSNL